MRLSLDEYFLKIAQVISTRSTCLRRQVGAVLVKGTQIISTGYNGVPTGMKHCETCVRAGVPSGERLDLCFSVHAEANAIVFSAKYGVGVNGATIYCTNRPCANCAGLIVNSGIVRVVYQSLYPDETAEQILSCIDVVKV